MANLFAWINTDARYHGIAQVPLAANDHAALKHACFLDASRVTTFREQELQAALDRGCISSGLAARVIACVQAEQPRTLTPSQLALFTANLAKVA
ncbi:hypothetical protein [Sphingobium nicotianae]|uniref:Uncharacterized protein n=1 Tax=Sphingobium nicotianae TaxID=2782607 RepID=A0A9X1IQG2_9SPHN|nr:hypothetical protein [Sphingobium nicotianae]MBT2186601.1 hypothetical protein [Sphingobium nicotianae]